MARTSAGETHANTPPSNQNEIDEESPSNFVLQNNDQEEQDQEQCSAFGEQQDTIAVTPHHTTTQPPPLVTTMSSTRRRRKRKRRTPMPTEEEADTDLPLLDEEPERNTRSRIFPTRRSTRHLISSTTTSHNTSANTIQHVTPSWRTESSTSTAQTAAPPVHLAAQESHGDTSRDSFVPHITPPPSIRDTARDYSRMSTGERFTNQRLGEPSYSFQHTRICICDQIRGDGDIIECETCKKEFHPECYNLIIKQANDDNNTFLCLECRCKKVIPDPKPWIELNANQMDVKLERFGIDPFSIDRRKAIRNMNQLKKCLQETNAEELYNKVIDSHPQAYPCPAKIDSEKVRQHTLCGRRFEVSQLLYSVERCSCCGKTKPYHHDPLVISSSGKKHKQTYFKEKFHPAFQCNCPLYCKGEQFYAVKKSTERNKYSVTHNGRAILESNAKLCDACYKDIESDTDLDFARPFSKRNGFGPSLQYPAPSPDEDANIQLGRELYSLLSNCTAAEEAAIRQIIPMLSITRLAMGNISSKGNTTCIWQDSKLSRVLPNLPSECKIIVIRTASNTSSTSHVKSTKFKRETIARILYLLKQTGVEPWNTIEISNENLDQWPEDGDLADLNQHLHIIVENSASNSSASSRNNTAACEADDEGPAPLQLGVAEETFDILIEHSSENHIANAAMAAEAIHVAIQGDTAVFRQQDVLPCINDFANMSTTVYSWTRAFPSLFIPTFTSVGNEMKWVILQDITGTPFPRETRVSMNRWYDYIMWRSDGRPTEHPTFSLVLYNHKIKTALQKQGAYCINTSEIDPNITMEELRNATNDSQRRRAVDSLVRKASLYSSNIPGTTSYWASTRQEFRATHMYHSYINNKTPNIWCTGSLAEYHEFPLRLLLSKYVEQLDGHTTSDANEILNNDDSFKKAVQKYKTIVTHYLASKMELWFALVLSPIFGIEDWILVFEFALSRGGIHFHSLIQALGDPYDSVADILKEWSLSVYTALKEVLQFIRDNRQEECPSLEELISSPDALETIENLCRSIGNGNNIWNNFHTNMQSTKLNAESQISDVLEGHFGINALHPGNFPQDFVKPGGLESLGYRKTSNQMLSSSDVIEKAELKKPKFQREDNVFDRCVNITNHTRCHKCSAYCWKETTKLVPFDQDYHNSECEKIHGSDGIIRVKETVSDCRMGFGKALAFDPSGENNRTRGKKFQLRPGIEFDGNGFPKYVAPRNHPRILQEPYAYNYYVANNDLQILLINSKGQETRESLGDDDLYSEYRDYLHIARMGGLEQHNGTFVVLNYICGYACKGNSNPRHTNMILSNITDAYCCREDTSNKTLRSLIGKHMNQISGSISISRDQSQFMLSGGKLKHNSAGTPRKCSVSSIPVDFLVDNNEAPAQRFEWTNIKHRYIAREDELEQINLYTYCCKHWNQNDKRPVQFFGYDDTVSWPMTETFSEWMLTFYHPWRDIEDLKSDGSFRTKLEANLVCLPPQKRAEIERAKRKISVDLSEGGNLIYGGVESSPTETRDNDRFDAAINVMDLYDNINIDQDNDFENDINDMQWNQLNSRIPAGYDWSLHYDESLETALTTYKDKYYEEVMNGVLNSNVDGHENHQLQLFNVDIFKPENARTNEQKFIIYYHLYNLYVWKEYFDTNNPELDPPLQSHLLVEGLPGTGKTFVIKTIRNMTRQILQDNNADVASAPTGCAASHFSGSTHNRCCDIPSGKSFQNYPTNLKRSNVSKIQFMTKTMRSIVCRIFDEHSMTGRSMFGWLKYRHEEFRRPQRIVDDNGRLIFDGSTRESLPEKIWSRPWGGIPMVYSFGDSAQLPPVMMKPYYDRSPAKPGTSDLAGKVAISNFMFPDDEDISKSTFVSMKTVIRQSDDRFKQLLTNMRNGCVNDDDVDFILARCLDKLSEEERQTFKTDTIHLTPDWKSTQRIVYQYLNSSLETPLAKFRAKLNSIRANGQNHCVKECKLPLLGALCKGATVMLLQNFVVEQFLMNGSIGTVQEVVYKQSSPDFNHELPSYVIVDFPKSNIPDDKKLIPNRPATHIPIPIVSVLCEKKCCSIQTIPLKVCVAITIHKSQGMTIGPREQFERAVVYLPATNSKSPPGLELVAMSRVTSPSNLAIGNSFRDLTRADIRSIGKTAKYQLRKDFEIEMERLCQNSQQNVKQSITNLDTSTEGKTYEGGCNFLLDWFNRTINS